MPVHLTEMSLHVWAMKQASHSHFSLTLLRFIYLFSISLTLFSVCNVTLMHVIKYKKTNKENRQMIKADVEKGCYALDQGAAAGYCYGNSARWSPQEEMSTLWRSGSKTKFLTLLSGWKIEKWPLVAYSPLACSSMKNAINGLSRNCLFSDLDSHLLFSVFCSSCLAYCPLQEEAI